MELGAWLHEDTKAQYRLVVTTPSTIWDHFTISTAHNMLTHLKNLKLRRLIQLVVHDMQGIDSAQVAAYTAGTPDDRTHMQCAANEKACNMNEVSKGSGRRWENSPRSGTGRKRERTTMDHGRVETRARVGEKGGNRVGKSTKAQLQ